jgi:hypothetical protein
MNTVVTGMKFAGDRDPPHNTQVRIENLGIPGRVQIYIKLPWQKEWKDLGLLNLVGTEIVLPLKLAFLCHAKEDKLQVENIGSRLLEDGFLTWYDDKDLLPGDSWEQVIEAAIEGCDYFLAFLSSRSVTKNGYVNRELRYALQQRERRPFGRRFIIPILLDNCVPPRELRDVHFVRIWESGSYEKLVKALGEPIVR